MSQSNLIGIRNFTLRWYAPIILIFLVGGLLQYLGLISPTQTNWLSLFLLGHVFLLRSSWRQIKHEVLIFLLLVFIGVVHFYHGTPLAYTATYIYYAICTVLAAIAGRVYAQRTTYKLNVKIFFKFVKYFLVLELAITSIQAVYTEQFINLSQAPIGYVDAIFGTFFLQSDAALAAVCELLVISAFFLPCKTNDRLVISLLSIGVIATGNSSAAKLTVVLLLLLLYGNSIYKRLGFGRHGFNILILFVVTCTIFAMYGSLLELTTNFLVRAVEDYDHREAWETASRFAPLGQIYAERINLIGRGALTYYNPITKQWLYNSGFSTLYSLYLDFGLIGALIYYAYQVNLIFKFTTSVAEFTSFLIVLASFSLFNFALTDVAFVFSFNAILYLNHRYKKLKLSVIKDSVYFNEQRQWT